MEVVTFPVQWWEHQAGRCHCHKCRRRGWIWSCTLMAISDHINLTDKTLIGFFSNLDEFGPRFPDMSDVLIQKFIEKAACCSRKLGSWLERRSLSGCYRSKLHETPVEIRAFQTLGASCCLVRQPFQKVIVRTPGLKVLGILLSPILQLVSKRAKPWRSGKVTERIKEDFKGLVKAILAEL